MKTKFRIGQAIQFYGRAGIYCRRHGEDKHIIHLDGEEFETLALDGEIRS